MNKMTASVYSDFCKGARILVPYIFLQEIGFTASIMLSEILAEYNYARNHKVSNYIGFIFDINRASKVLKIAAETIVEQLNYLEKLDFIEFYNIGLSDSYYVRVNDDNILNLKKEHEAKNFNNNWDVGLLASVNPTHKADKFSESTLKIKHRFDTHAKNSQSIPVLYYFLIDYYVKEYEQLRGNIFDRFSDINDFLQECATKYDCKDGIRKVYYMLQNVYSQTKKEQETFNDEIPPDF